MYEDLTGKRFDKIFVIGNRQIVRRPGRQQYTVWLCQCDCGKQWNVRAAHLKKGKSEITGCLSCRKQRSYQHEDLTGQRFGRWTILGSRQVRKSLGGWGIPTWLCRCDCGTEQRCQVSNMKLGTHKSCGCWIEEIRRKPRKPRGLPATKSVWNSYKYGARKRGILWQLSWENFVCLIHGSCAYCGASNSMVTFKHKDQVAHNGIDRSNSDGPYSVENCVSCCKACNLAKSTMSFEEFKSWVQRVHAYLLMPTREAAP